MHNSNIASFSELEETNNRFWTHPRAAPPCCPAEGSCPQAGTTSRVEAEAGIQEQEMSQEGLESSMTFFSQTDWRTQAGRDCSKSRCINRDGTNALLK